MISPDDFPGSMARQLTGMSVLITQGLIRPWPAEAVSNSLDHGRSRLLRQLIKIAAELPHAAIQVLRCGVAWRMRAVRSSGWYGVESGPCRRFASR
jgi:uncharacterized protein (DUF2236 family)